MVHQNQLNKYHFQKIHTCIVNLASQHHPQYLPSPNMAKNWVFGHFPKTLIFDNSLRSQGSAIQIFLTEECSAQRTCVLMMCWANQHTSASALSVVAAFQLIYIEHKFNMMTHIWKKRRQISLVEIQFICKAVREHLCMISKLIWKCKFFGQTNNRNTLV